jgi:hypothetical protein
MDNKLGWGIANYWIAVIRGVRDVSAMAGKPQDKFLLIVLMCLVGLVAAPSLLLLPFYLMGREQNKQKQKKYM